jgi:DNA-binding GntR family transcriptional regulator
VDVTGEDAPKYRQIADELARRIESGELPPGARLPSKAELMDTCGVALGTVNRAIDDLRRRGLVETVQGVGMFACAPPPPQEDLAATVTRLSERIEALEDRVGKIEDGRPASGNS